ncbi:uncharacterized protein LOC125499942 [Athalia rosae]|uniref:uncharacterized protein LOC125499942 n=1 Tax=Athalia rosae TaxID=37344 RepID=UPI002033E889|nr:uncharacterized protein LOC125499942 [Athalia rosae]XP_048506348.1 uncharacterized protein LOC125499942 [Athalia rosae]
MTSLIEENRDIPLEQSSQKSVADVLKKKKDQLRKDIEELKALNFRIKCSLNISKFGDIKHLFQSKSPQYFAPGKIPDVIAKYTDELYRFTGIHCIKFVENESLFNFACTSSNADGGAYGVQIKNTAEKIIIGKWIMPMSVDMKSILKETPLQDPDELKSFLRNCKHHIDCYTNRMNQFIELQAVINQLSQCTLDTNLGYTVITLKFFNMQELDSEETHNVMLYLLYKSNRVRPQKMTIDSSSSQALNDTVIAKCKSYFKNFKCFDLNKAFKETISAVNAPIMWKLAEEDEESLDLTDSGSTSSEANFVRQTDVTKKQTKRRRVTSRRNRTLLDDEEVSGDSNKTQDALTPSVLDSIDDRDEKYIEKRRKLVTKKSPKKKPPKPKSISESTTRVLKNPSNRSLRQTTLIFKNQKPQSSGPVDVEDEPLSKKVSTFLENDTPITQKSKINSFLPKEHKFGTSTPLRPVKHGEIRHVGSIGGVSPIKSNKRLVSKAQKQRAKSD